MTIPNGQEIIVVATAHLARKCGVKDTDKLLEEHGIVMWWPDLGVDVLRGRRFHRVTIDSSLGRVTWGFTAATRRAVEEGLRYIRSAFIPEGGLWLET